jgi:uncharacterized protein (TIGR00369 family)
MNPTQNIPPGFRVARIGGDFLHHNGPLYGKLDGSRVLIGFVVEKRHTNPLGICHGGMLATFVDMLVPCANMYDLSRDRRFLPTISLQIDYLSPAKLGAWVQGEAQVLRTTRNLLFGQGLVTADGEPSLRFSGIFKLGPLFADQANHDPMGLKGGPPIDAFG